MLLVTAVPVLEDEFIDLQQEFMEKHYHNFDDVEENKLIYMDIFKLYVSKLVHNILSTIICLSTLFLI